MIEFGQDIGVHKTFKVGKGMQVAMVTAEIAPEYWLPLALSCGKERKTQVPPFPQSVKHRLAHRRMPAPSIPKVARRKGQESATAAGSQDQGTHR